MIKVKIPEIKIEEHKYVINVMLGYFLGLDYKITVSEDCYYKNEDKYYIELVLKNCKIILPDILLTTKNTDWLNQKSLPKTPLETYDFKDKKIPVIYGDFNCSIKNKKNYIPIDIFGSSFFMLTRYEEVVKKEKDEHGRFIGKNSLAYKEGFIETPIVNEYLEILWGKLKKIDKNLKRKKREFKTVVSCDVDSPFKYYFWNIFKISKVFLGDVLKRRSLYKAFKNLKSWFFVKFLNYKLDPFYTFNYMMDVADSNNLKITFNFFGLRQKVMGGNYDIKSKVIKKLLHNIHSRGHFVGFHASYNSYKDQEKTLEEFKRLKDFCKKEGITQKIWGSRQHYLRWSTPETSKNLENAQITYDSILGYQDILGFRCGTCYEYPLFDLKSRIKLSIIERPLVIMDCTIFDNRYMNMEYTKETLCYIKKIKKQCTKFKGNFVFLWHNSYFMNNNSKNFYEKIINL
jgi:hypothetical protein